jgi:hypothetical protein
MKPNSLLNRREGRAISARPTPALPRLNDHAARQQRRPAVFSSKWNGSRTTDQTINTGNIQVHQH